MGGNGIRSRRAPERATIALLNPMLFIVAAWLVHQTFFVVDRSRYAVEVPDLAAIFIAPPLPAGEGGASPCPLPSGEGGGESASRRVREPPYVLIPAVFDAQSHREAEVVVGQTPVVLPAPPTVVAFILDRGAPPDPSAHAVALRVGSSTRIVRVGDALPAGRGWEPFAGWRVREIRERAGEPLSRPAWEALIDTPNGLQVLAEEPETGEGAPCPTR